MCLLLAPCLSRCGLLKLVCPSARTCVRAFVPPSFPRRKLCVHIPDVVCMFHFPLNTTRHRKASQQISIYFRYLYREQHGRSRQRSDLFLRARFVQRHGDFVFQPARGRHPPTLPSTRNILHSDARNLLHSLFSSRLLDVRTEKLRGKL